MKLLKSFISMFVGKCYFETYPANDFINNALAILLKDFETNEHAFMELYHAVCAAGGYFYYSNAMKLYRHGIDVPKRCINDTLNEYILKLKNKKAE